MFEDIDFTTEDTAEIIEQCEEINQVSQHSLRGTLSLDDASRTLGSTIANILSPNSCWTGQVRQLSQQLIDEMNNIEADSMVSFADLNVNILHLGVNPFLQPAAKESLRQAIAQRGQIMRINSAYRTLAQQLMLYTQFKSGWCGISLAARPGLSDHEDGLAIDIEDYSSWRPILENYGWEWKGPRDPVHFSYRAGGTRYDISNIAVRAFQRLWNKYNPDDKIAEDGNYGPATDLRLKKSPIVGFGVIAPTVPTTPSPQPETPSGRILRLSQPRMQGEDVRQLQEALLKANISVEVDGVFGRNTDRAVKQFQQQNGLQVDGVVGEATRFKLGLSNTAIAIAI